MRFEVSYQSEVAQQNFDEANTEVVYCFENKALKQAKLLKEAERFGRGVLFVVNGKDVLEQICF